MPASLVSALAVLSLCSVILATEYFVDNDEAVNGSGTSGSPFNNLQAAFDAVTGGDIISLVPTPGDYSVASAVSLGTWDGSLTIRSPEGGSAAQVAVLDDSGFLSFTNTDSENQLELLIQNVGFTFTGIHNEAPFRIRSNTGTPGSIVTFDTVYFDFEEITSVDSGSTITVSATNFTFTDVAVSAFQSNGDLQFVTVDGGEVNVSSVSFDNGMDCSDGYLFGLNDIHKLSVDNVSFPSVPVGVSFPSNRMTGFLEIDPSGLTTGAILDSQINNVVFNDIQDENGTGMMNFVSVVADSSLQFNNVTASNPQASYPITLINVVNSYSYFDSTTSTTVRSIIGQLEMSGLMISAPADSTASGIFLNTGNDFRADVVTVSDCTYTAPMKSGSFLFVFVGAVSSRVDISDVTINALPYYIDTSRRKTVSTNVLFMGESMTSPTTTNFHVNGFSGSYVVRSNSQLTMTNSSLVDSTAMGFLSTQSESHVVGLVVENTTLSGSLFTAGNPNTELSLSGVSIDGECVLSSSNGGLIFAQEDVAVSTVDPIIISQELLPLTGPLFHVNFGTIDAELDITGCGDLSGVIPLAADISSFDQTTRRFDNRISLNISDSRVESCDPADDDDGGADDDDGADDGTDDGTVDDGSVSSAASASHMAMVALFVVALLF